MTISLVERLCPFISGLKKVLQAFYPYAFAAEYQEQHRTQSTRFSQYIFNEWSDTAPQAEDEWMIQPDCMADDFGRKTVSSVKLV